MGKGEKSEESSMMCGKNIVTGRNSMEIQADLEDNEGVVGVNKFQGKRGWEVEV